MGQDLILIKRNGSRVPLANRRTATVVTSAKQNWALNGEDTVDITVTSPFAQSYAIGDKITVFGRDYTLNRLPKPKKDGMHNFQYTLQFEGVQYDLLRVTYDVTIDTTNNQTQDVLGDSLIGNLRRYLTVLVANANRVFPGKWGLGVVPDTAQDVSMSFGESDNCLSVLQSILGKFDESYYFDIVKTNGVYVIHVLSMSQTLPFTLTFGKGGGLYSLTRDNVSSSNIVTRLKVYGSTSNITSKYRADRLCLPGRSKGGSFIEKPDAVARYGIFEGRKHFENIKPSFTGHVQVLGDSVLEFIDNTISFDINEKDADGNTKYLMNGTSAKVHFNTGNLAGYEFEISKYDHATRKVTLRKFTDDRGDSFPSATSAAFQFKAASGNYPGDEYKILDITLPDTFIAKAESQLLSEALKYYDQNSQPKVSYSVSVTKEFLEKRFATDAGIVNVFAPGQYIKIKDADIDVDKSIRIKSISRNILDPYEYSLTISDTVTTSVTNRVLSELIEIDKVLTINDLKDPARARANWRTSREVMDMVFDPEGDYYTDKIKPNSIDTLALSVGAKSMQFGLTNTVFQPNYNGNPQILKWQGGVLTHYTIKEEAAVSWVLADGQITMPTNNQAYYIYAKCNKNGTDGTIDITTKQHKVEEDANWYYFWIGVVNSVDAELKARSIALSYGFTMVNGRFIKTGCVQSADGGTYFDLDKGEIGGRIVFNSNGELKTLEELGQEALDSKNFIDNTLPGLFDEIKAQLDGQIEQFFEEVDPLPTMEQPDTPNAPASEWTTQAMKDAHLGDLYYNTTSGKVWRYIKKTDGSVVRYVWSALTDAELAQALALANDALTLAKTKRRIFTATPVTPYEIGDLWVKGASGGIYVCTKTRESGSFTSSDWGVASNYTDGSDIWDYLDTTLNDTIADITNQLDGKIESWFQDTDPALAWLTTEEKLLHVGDMWYNRTTKTLSCYCNTGKAPNPFAWVKIEDQKALDAYNKASDAQDTADGKRRIFVDTPTTPYDVGDLWVQGDAGGIMVCKQERLSGAYVADDWGVASNYTDGSDIWEFINTMNDDITNSLDTITTQLDGKIETWFQSADPATDWTTDDAKNLHVGDMWYNTTLKTLSRYCKTEVRLFNKPPRLMFYWMQIQDQKAIDAYTLASQANTTKRQVFLDSPWLHLPYDKGDLWLDGKDLRHCITSRIVGDTEAGINDWVLSVTYDNTKTIIDGGLVTSGTIQVAGDEHSILAGITGSGTANTDIRMWAGAAFENRKTAPFRVQQNGKVFMTDADVTGRIKATSGEFSGTINALSGKIGGLSIRGNDLVGLNANGDEVVKIGLGSLPGIGSAFRTEMIQFTLGERPGYNTVDVTEPEYSNGFTTAAVRYYGRMEVDNNSMPPSTYSDTWMGCRLSFTLNKAVKNLTLGRFSIGHETMSQTGGGNRTDVTGGGTLYRVVGSSRTKIKDFYLSTQGDDIFVDALVPGNYEIDFDVQVSHSGTYWQGNVCLYIDGGIFVTVADTVANTTILAPDGILVIQGSDKYLSFSATNGFETRFGDHGIKVSSAGTQMLVNGTWKTIQNKT